MPQKRRLIVASATAAVAAVALAGTALAQASHSTARPRPPVRNLALTEQLVNRHGPRGKVAFVAFNVDPGGARPQTAFPQQLYEAVARAARTDRH